MLINKIGGLKVFLIIVTICFMTIVTIYRPFFKTKVKSIFLNNKEIKVSVYKSKSIYLLIDSTTQNPRVFFIDKVQKTIVIPNFRYIKIFENLILWERSSVIGVSLISAKTGEQEIKWDKEGIYFTRGEGQKYKYNLIW